MDNLTHFSEQIYVNVVYASLVLFYTITAYFALHKLKIFALRALKLL